MECSDKQLNIFWLSPADAQKRLSQAHYTQLTDKGSLTRSIRTNCPEQFRLELIDHSLTSPDEGERALLELDDTAKVLSRRIFLCCGDYAKVFAKTIIGLTEKNKSLTDKVDGLGSQSLGSILFNDPLAEKRLMHLALISIDHPFFKGVDLASQNYNNSDIWVRRSVYDYEGCDLIVYEAFLMFQAFN
jgi:chorismate-pyruvate lyase